MATWSPFPTEICGVKIPPVSMDDLTDVDKLQGLATNVAVNVGAKATGLDGVLDVSKDMHNVLKKGANAVGTSCTVLSAGAESISKIQTSMDPLMPLFNAKNDPVGAFNEMNQKNLQACLEVIRNVLSLQDLMNNVGKVLHDVQNAFTQLGKSAQPLAEKVKDLKIPSLSSANSEKPLAETADKFGLSLNFEGCLSGIQNFFEEIAALIKELSDIDAILRPILDGCKDGDYVDVAVFGAQRWEEVTKTLQKFLPAWEKVQTLYNKSQGFSAQTLAKTKAVWDTFLTLVNELCTSFNVSVPDWMKLDKSPLECVSAPPAIEIKSANETQSPLSVLLLEFLKCCANRRQQNAQVDHA